MMGTTTPTAAGTIEIDGRVYRYYPLARLLGHDELNALPYVVRVLVENVARAAPEALPALLDRARGGSGSCEVPVHPNRVMLHDTTCLPALADLAAMRDTVAELGGDAAKVNPVVPVDLVVDHSVIVEEYGGPEARLRNLAVDFGRNGERYGFIKWAEARLRNFRVVPPGTGIIHQVNMESLAKVVWRDTGVAPAVLHPDLLVATDSHTPMINAVGVVGWGVGGLEAQSAMLGEPITIAYPRVVGVRITGRRQRGVTATDIALTVTQRLRTHGVVDTFLEFFGAGVAELSWADRATIANMAPEYGATCAYFPYDEDTRSYLRLSGRDEEHRAVVDAYLGAQGLKRTASGPVPSYDDIVDVDLGVIEPCLAGPRRPDQRQPLRQVPSSFRSAVPPATTEPVVSPVFGPVPGGVIGIAAITSCTNTANPALLIQAGLLARNAVAKGLVTKPWVKTSLSPGSRVVPGYLTAAGLMPALEDLGFAVVGFGCMTCIGNSGPLHPELERLTDEGTVPVAVLSGNRNFEGRVNPRVTHAYLASPPMVVAYALAGSILHDLETGPLGHDREGRPVRLADIWPSDAEVAEVVATAVTPSLFRENNERLWTGTPAWRELGGPAATRFDWDPASTYIRRPPYLAGVVAEPGPDPRLEGARVLLRLGDNVTTDRISPAGAIPPDSAAGKYLAAAGVRPSEFNQYSTRRSNHEVMLRGAFTNPAVRNMLLPTDEQHAGALAPSVDGSRVLPVYDAAETYRRAGAACVVVAGKNYGAGSSRDWAAKAQRLLGVRAVLAESFERIHRSNLIGMGVLPLVFTGGETAETYRFSTEDLLDLTGLDRLGPGTNRVGLLVRGAGGGEIRRGTVLLRLDSFAELAYLEHGGVLPYLARKIARDG